MDPLTSLGIKHQTDKAIPHKFTQFYDQHLGSYRDSFTNILEIGVYRKGSLRMWRDYFTKASVNGIDIDPSTMFYEDRIKTYLMSQTDLDAVWHAFDGVDFDLIIDDGSHVTSHQINSFLSLHKKLVPGGFYILEDLHTSFMPSYVDTNVTAYEFLKEIDYETFGIDYVEFFHNMDEIHNVDCITSVIKFK